MACLPAPKLASRARPQPSPRSPIPGIVKGCAAFTTRHVAGWVRAGRVEDVPRSRSVRGAAVRSVVIPAKGRHDVMGISGGLVQPALGVIACSRLAMKPGISRRQRRGLRKRRNVVRGSALVAFPPDHDITRPAAEVHAHAVMIDDGYRRGGRRRSSLLGSEVRSKP
jgi:hypothetical protein